MNRGVEKADRESVPKLSRGIFGGTQEKYEPSRSWPRSMGTIPVK